MKVLPILRGPTEFRFDVVAMDGPA